MRDNAENRRTNHRYKLEIFSQEIVVRTLGVPGYKSPFRVVEVARRELKTVPTATHVRIRSLCGREHNIFASDGWWKCQMKAFKL